ncbi:MAG: permease [Vicinamibacteria bacterium]|nr:permease [Vicinamibacteria bacterium]
MSQQNLVVGIYDTHTGAEAAIKELQRSNFNMKQLSIVGRGYHTEEQVTGFYNIGDRMKVWGSQGAFWGGFWGLLFGSAFFVLPGFGPVMVLGPAAAWIVGALESAAVVGGLSALGAGLYGAGIPKDSVLQYETAVKTDKFVVVAHGTAEEVAKARGVLHTTGAAKISQHNAPIAA